MPCSDSHHMAAARSLRAFRGPMASSADPYSSPDRAFTSTTTTCDRRPAHEVQFAQRSALILGQHAVPSLRKEGGGHLLAGAAADHPLEPGRTSFITCLLLRRMCTRAAGWRLDETVVADARQTLVALRRELAGVHRRGVGVPPRSTGRDLPWRRTHDPYEILVSEVMLQQTQVARVLDKYPAFLAAFPTVQRSGGAPTVADVLAAWQGLGYNRRALALHRAAKIIVDEHGGRVPELRRRTCAVSPASAPPPPRPSASSRSAGPSRSSRPTSGRPSSTSSSKIGTASPTPTLLPLVEPTLDRDDPREWFYALMDYGVWVKKTYGNPEPAGASTTPSSRRSPAPGGRRGRRLLQALLAAAPAARSAGAASRPLLEARRESAAEVLSVPTTWSGRGSWRRTATPTASRGAGSPGAAASPA